jgi:hypothetical protein
VTARYRAVAVDVARQIAQSRREGRHRIAGYVLRLVDLEPVLKNVDELPERGTSRDQHPLLQSGERIGDEVGLTLAIGVRQRDRSVTFIGDVERRRIG